MKTNKKVLVIVFIILGLLSVATIVNVGFNFIDFGKKNTIEKAESIAESVRDGLTAHMALNAMDKRDVFLDNMIKHQNVKTLRVLRSESVINEFGKGRIDPYKYDDIEKEVLAKGETITSLIHTKKDQDILRITIPYTATKYSNPNCLSCHANVNEGDILGAISMELDMSDVKEITFDTVQKTIVITLLFLIIAIVVSNYFIRPYIKLFDDLEEGISKAYKGDFTYHVQTTLSDEAGEVADRLNELSEIFRFKRTIELDKNKEQIYKRIKYILENNLHLKEFLLYENSILDKKRSIAIASDNFSEAELKEFRKSTQTCRAFRTKQIVYSNDFHKVCEICYKEDKESVCLPFNISEDNTLTLLIYVNSEDELRKVKEIVPIISNYIEISTPVLQTKLLMDKLREKSLKDPMTGLYNRRFLDNYIDNGLYEGKNFSVMMVDVDFFKDVNDTYGHDIGDEVIKGLAEVLKNSIKGSDLAVRFGGEEFLLIVYDTSMESSQKIANEIRESFSKKVFKSSVSNFSKTLSVGIASYPQDSQTAWQTIKYADVALYNAKETGRNKVVYFEEKMYQEDKI